jgi:hypothetical protein
MFFTDDIAFTKHGYYLVNGIKTLSKFEAWQFANGNFNDIQFIYNDDILSSYDWTVEPTEDIYELYAQRAIQLRKDYDYIVLMYSGGIDSHVMLKTFLENNIQLDEICTFSNTDVEEKTGKLNQEVFNKAIPFVQTLDLKKLGTKFRHIDIGKLVIDQWSDEFYFENFHYFTHGPQWHVIRSHKFKENIKDHMELNLKGKRVCYIWGHDKPNIFLRNNQYCYKVADTCVDFGARQYVNQIMLKEKFLNFYDEAFYISREFPKIIIKQCHLLVNKMKKIPKSDTVRLHSIGDLANTGPFVVHHKFDDDKTKRFVNNYKFLSRNEIAKIIYPNEMVETFGDDKVKGSMIFSKKDQWFTQSNHSNQQKWEDRIHSLISENKTYYHNIFDVEHQKYQVRAPFAVSSQPYIIAKGQEEE